MRFVFKFLQFCGFLMLLNGCQTIHNAKSGSKELQPGRYSILQDSAPDGPIPSFFKSFIPKNEPLSPYGNPPSYRVGGQTYYVMKSAKGYKARGLASWYASKFHKQRTSSGEAYDMYALTAAHKTLPLPTYLKVKNLQNGREIIVKVNDRGPFHENRLIDLSYGAAVKLGIFPKGTAPVEIEAINTFAKPPIKTQAHMGRYYIQAGAFTSKALAEQLRSKIIQLTKDGVQVNYQNRRYLVRVGPFSTSAQTDNLKKQLQAQGIRGAFTVLL